MHHILRLILLKKDSDYPFKIELRAITLEKSGNFNIAKDNTSPTRDISVLNTSNKTRPGLTTQTQLSTAPFPRPIRTSRGLRVIG